MAEQPLPRTVIIMRHGQTDWNAEFRFQGRTDIPLNEVGVEQARAAAPAVAALKPTRIVASPLSRAFLTAQAVGEVLGIPVESHEGLVETDLGIWEGMKGEDVKAQYPDEIKRWTAGDPEQKAGLRGESKIDLGERTYRATREIMENSAPGTTTLLVMHGGASRALIGALMGLDVADWKRFEGLSNCAWSILKEDFAGVTSGEMAAEGAAGVSDENDGDDGMGFAKVGWRLCQHNMSATDTSL